MMAGVRGFKCMKEGGEVDLSWMGRFYVEER